MSEVHSSFKSKIPRLEEYSRKSEVAKIQDIGPGKYKVPDSFMRSKSVDKVSSNSAALKLNKLINMDSLRNRHKPDHEGLAEHDCPKKFVNS